MHLYVVNERAKHRREFGPINDYVYRKSRNTVVRWVKVFLFFVSVIFLLLVFAFTKRIVAFDALL